MILLCYFHLNQNTKIPNNSNFYATIWLYLVSCTTRSLQTSCLLTRSVFPLSLKNTKKGCILHGFGVSFSTTSKLFQTSWHLQSRKHEKGKDNKKEGSLHDASHSIRILIDWITRTIHHHFFPALTLTALTKFSVHWLENLIFPFQMIIYAFMGLFVIPHAQGVDLFEDLIQFKEDVINGNYVSK